MDIFFQNILLHFNPFLFGLIQCHFLSSSSEAREDLTFITERGRLGGSGCGAWSPTGDKLSVQNSPWTHLTAAGQDIQQDPVPPHRQSPQTGAGAQDPHSPKGRKGSGAPSSGTKYQLRLFLPFKTQMGVFCSLIMLFKKPSCVVFISGSNVSNEETLV